MATGRLGRYERLILRPLSFTLPVAAIVYFVSQSWGIGVLLVIMWFLVGIVGQSLNPAKSFSELTQGTTPEERASLLSSVPTHLETMQIGKISLALFWIVAITATILGHHHGLRWIYAIPSGLVAALVAILLGGWISMRDARS